MPLALFEKDGILPIVYSGAVTGKDLENWPASLKEAEARTGRVPNRLVDLTRVTRLELTFTDMLVLAERRRGLRFKNAFKCALVAYEPVTTGFAQMYEALNDHPQTTIEVFPDRDTALRWVGE